MSKQSIEELVDQIMKLLEPVKTKCNIAFVIVSPDDEEGAYSVMGNMPEGMNKKLIRDVAIDMATKDLIRMMTEALGEVELENPNTTVN
jgi:hypothetical protein